MHILKGENNFYFIFVCPTISSRGNTHAIITLFFETFSVVPVNLTIKNKILKTTCHFNSKLGLKFYFSTDTGNEKIRYLVKFS